MNLQEQLKAAVDERNRLVAESRAILEAAKAAGRDTSAEENEKWDKINAAIDAKDAHVQRLNTQIQREAKMAESAGRRTEATVTVSPSGVSRTEAEVVELAIGKGRNYRITPGSQLAERATAAYRDSFSAYVGQGQVSAGLLTSSDPKGGYLAPTQLSTNLIKFLDNAVFMRQLSTVETLTQAVSLGVPSWDTDPGDADWTAEVPASDISEDDTATVGKRELTPHLLTKLVKISQKLIRSSVIGIEDLVTQRLGYKFAVTEENKFLNGTGAFQPLGVFVASANGVSTGRDVTASATTSFNADDLHNVIYNCKQAYQRTGSWIMHRDAVKMARKLKDGTGQYLWQPGLQASEPNMLLGRPLYMSEYAPNTFTTGLYVGLFGDFKIGYMIVDSLQLEIQRLGELFSLKNQVGLLGRKETDGMPVLEEAFSRLKLA